MIAIDGSMGEGGGQCCGPRSPSPLTGTPLRIDKIRAGRARPGLMRQHLVAVHAASASRTQKFPAPSSAPPSSVFGPERCAAMTTASPSAARAARRSCSKPSCCRSCSVRPRRPRSISKAVLTTRWRRPSTSSRAASCRCSPAWARGGGSARTSWLLPGGRWSLVRHVAAARRARALGSAGARRNPRSKRRGALRRRSRVDRRAPGGRALRSARLGARALPAAHDFEHARARQRPHCQYRERTRHGAGHRLR